jgi:hypothetical protein
MMVIRIIFFLITINTSRQKFLQQTELDEFMLRVSYAESTLTLNIYFDIFWYNFIDIKQFS